MVLALQITFGALALASLIFAGFAMIRSGQISRNEEVAELRRLMEAYTADSDHQKGA